MKSNSSPGAKLVSSAAHPVSGSGVWRPLAAINGRKIGGQRSVQARWRPGPIYRELVASSGTAEQAGAIKRSHWPGLVANTARSMPVISPYLLFVDVVDSWSAWPLTSNSRPITSHRWPLRWPATAACVLLRVYKITSFENSTKSVIITTDDDSLWICEILAQTATVTVKRCKQSSVDNMRSRKKGRKLRSEDSERSDK